MNDVWSALTIDRITRDLLQPWRHLLGVAQTLVRDPFFDPVAADLAQSQHKKLPYFFLRKWLGPIGQIFEKRNPEKIDTMKIAKPLYLYHVRKE